jgi:hypothetical protein
MHPVNNRGGFRMYSPTIEPLLVRKLYQLKQRRKLPMTRLVREAIEEYLVRFEKNNNPLLNKENNYGDS